MAASLALPSMLSSVRCADAQSSSNLLQLKLLLATQQLSSPRQACEAFCVHSVITKDKTSLERHLIQCRPYGLSEELQALELLVFLVESKTQQFFAGLERIQIDLRTSSPHIRFVVNLERNLTEGSYHSALRARKDSTSPMFGWLLEDLEDTVRDEVASCIEVSHKTLTLQRAKELLNLESPQAAAKFAESREGWFVSSNGVVSFPNRAETKQLNKDSLPTDWTIRECLNMAIELDRIV